MITIDPQPGQMMTWGDVKEWIDSMSPEELCQAAFIYREPYIGDDDWQKTEEHIVGTTVKNTTLPRLIGKTYKP